MSNELALAKALGSDLKIDMGNATSIPLVGITELNDAVTALYMGGGSLQQGYSLKFEGGGTTAVYGPGVYGPNTGNMQWWEPSSVSSPYIILSGTWNDEATIQGQLGTSWQGAGNETDLYIYSGSSISGVASDGMNLDGTYGYRAYWDWDLYTGQVRPYIYFTGTTNGDAFVGSPLDIWMNTDFYNGKTFAFHVSSPLTLGIGQVSADLGSYADQSYIDTHVTNLKNSAPASLDSVEELATALGSDSVVSDFVAWIPKQATTTFKGDGVTTEFVIPHDSGNVDVFVNGVLMIPELMDSTSGATDVLASGYEYQSGYAGGGNTTTLIRSGLPLYSIFAQNLGFLADWQNNAVPNGVMGDWYFRASMSGNYTEISSYNMPNGYNGNRFMPHPDDFQLDFNDTVEPGGGGQAIGNYSLPIKMLEAEYNGSETVLMFSVQDDTQNQAGTPFFDRWITLMQDSYAPYTGDKFDFSSLVIGPSTSSTSGESCGKIKFATAPENNAVIAIRTY